MKQKTKKEIGNDKENERSQHGKDAIHAMVECMRLGFSDCRDYVCDEKFDKNPEKDKMTAQKMMSEEVRELSES